MKLATAFTFPQTRPLTRIDALLVLLVTGLGASLSLLLAVPDVVGTFHDDAIYLANATALAAGDGYRLINLPGEPFQTKYPPLYPALLALLLLVAPPFPQNAALLVLPSALCAGLAPALWYSYLVWGGYCRRSLALVAALLVATAHLYLYYGSLVLSEMPFSLLFVLSLWSFEHALRSPAPRRGQEALAGVLLAALCLCRLVGVVLLPLYLLWCAMLRRKSFALFATFLLLFLPWAMWSAGGAGAWERDAGEAYYTNYFGWWAEGALHWQNVIVFNVVQLGVFLYQRLFNGALDLTPAIPGEAVSAILTLLGFLLWFGLWRGRSSRLLPTAVILLYIAAICVFPGPPTRILIPLLMPLVALQLEGVVEALATLSRGRLLTALLALLLLAGMGANLVELGRIRAVNHATHFPYLELPDKPVSWQRYEEVFDWIKEHTDEGDILAATYDTMLFLYTGRKAFQPYVLLPSRWLYGAGTEPYGSDEELLRRWKDGAARYLVLVPMPVDQQEKAFYDQVDRIAEAPDSPLSIVFRGADPRFRVYRIVNG